LRTADVSQDTSATSQHVCNDGGEEVWRMAWINNAPLVHKSWSRIYTVIYCE